MNYEELSLQELKELAKEKGLKNISKLKKEDLINFLNEVEQEQKIEEKTSFVEKVTEEGYKLTSEGDEVVEGILEVLPLDCLK